MARKFNYTGRQRVSQRDVQIELIRASEGLAFDARIELNEYDLPSDAQVWVEAYRRASRMHFAFGTVSVLQAPVDRLLAEVDSPDAIQFRVRITAVGAEQGKLLAVADRIKPAATDDPSESTTSLLGLASAPLHGRVWAMQYHDNGPYLVLDESIENRHLVAASSAFVSLVLPEAFREILMRLLTLRVESWEEDDETAWQSKWLDFAQRIPGAGSMPERADQGEDEGAMIDWIDDCTACFARSIESLRCFELLQKESDA